MANNARIGYKTLFTDSTGTVTASDEATGYEKEYAYDWKQYSWWKQSATGTSWLQVAFAAAQDADYMTVWGHNLDSVGGSVKPQYSSDGISWSDATTATTPTDNTTIYIDFTSQSAKYWRCLVVTTTGQSVIAGIQIGERTELQRGLRAGFAPPTLSPDVELRVGRSENGVNLGASVRYQGVSGSIEMTNITPAWARSGLEPLIDHLNSGYPAVFSWDATNYNDEAILMWISRQLPSVSYSSPLYMDFTLPYEGTE